MSLLRSAGTVSSLTLLSRVTGLIRDMLIARYLGVTGATDAFYVAFRIPNLLRRLFAEGAFTQAFLPMLSEVREKESPERARSFMDNAFSLLALVVLLTSVLGVLAAPAVIWLIATGFARQPETFDLAVALTRFMFPYIIFMSLVAFASAILNTWKRFAIPAFTPVLLNLSFIVCVIFLSPLLAQPVWALAIAVIGGGVLQLAAQLLALRRICLLPRLVAPSDALADPAVRQTLRLMVPAIAGVSVAPVSILINTNIASHLAHGSVTWLSYADRLMEFPTALLGVALATVLLPSLSAAYNRGELERYRQLLDQGLRLVILLGLPAAVGLWLLGDCLAAALFQGRNFGASDVWQTALAIEGYAVGLVGLVGIKIVAPAFYARQDIRTPVRVAIMSLVFVQLCNLLSVPALAHAGLALSVGLGACLNTLALLVILRRRGWFLPLPGWRLYLARVIAAALVMGAFLILSQDLLGLDWVTMQAVWGRRLGYAIALIAAAAAVYFAALALLGWRASELREVSRGRRGAAGEPS